MVSKLFQLILKRLRFFSRRIFWVFRTEFQLRIKHKNKKCCCCCCLTTAELAATLPPNCTPPPNLNDTLYRKYQQSQLTDSRFVSLDEYQLCNGSRLPSERETSSSTCPRTPTSPAVWVWCPTLPSSCRPTVLSFIWTEQVCGVGCYSTRQPAAAWLGCSHTFPFKSALVFCCFFLFFFYLTFILQKEKKTLAGFWRESRNCGVLSPSSSTFLPPLLLTNLGQSLLLP